MGQGFIYFFAPLSAHVLGAVALLREQEQEVPARHNVKCHESLRSQTIGERYARHLAGGRGLAGELAVEDLERLQLLRPHHIPLHAAPSA